MLFGFLARRRNRLSPARDQKQKKIDDMADIEGIEAGEVLLPKQETEEHERKGTVWTAAAHILTAVFGSGVLALPWSVAQLGWIAGALALIGFSCITYYTSTLLADTYRAPDPVTGSRNPTYTEAVRAYLSPRKVNICGVVQYVNLWGTLVGYTITAAISMKAINHWLYQDGYESKGDVSSTVMLQFGIVQLILSQLPSLEKITWLSVMSAIMSFAYSFIGLGLSVAKWIVNGHIGFLVGKSALSPGEKTWNSLQALGNIAFAYTFAEVLIEIQDTLRPSPPENMTMKKATFYGMGGTTIFYLAMGFAGYGAFGNNTPGNILSAFGCFRPSWLVGIANICIVLHLLGAYQIYAQPIFAVIESRVAARWPEVNFVNWMYTINVPVFKQVSISFSLSKLVLRSIIILITTLVTMMVPFFNAVLGLLGAISFWPMTVYFPISMHIAQKKISRGTPKWLFLQSLSIFCLVTSLAVTVGSAVDIASSLKLPE
ncbi:amino acid permease 6-like protein [Carex littledalei]|uniref:Amino acid permease 6-like protein n=1 Tax=Carex littledalei TaxID=544730 RepID=A0A833VP26_9POAL|nr:amino acid permease 6-like protein [Carex littledalei]